MNINIISKYLQFLRKSHDHTQEELAKRLNLSRQAVSKWETGTAIPDLEVLLEISKLYGITINDILEPHIQPRRMTDLEQLSTIPEKELKEILKQFDTKSLVTALMGASPEINRLCERLFPVVNTEISVYNHNNPYIGIADTTMNEWGLLWASGECAENGRGRCHFMTPFSRSSAPER